MFLSIILSIITLILLVFVALVVCIGGAGFILIFGDVIICIALIVWIIRKLTKKKRK